MDEPMGKQQQQQQQRQPALPPQKMDFWMLMSSGAGTLSPVSPFLALGPPTRDLSVDDRPLFLVFSSVIAPKTMPLTALRFGLRVLPMHIMYSIVEYAMRMDKSASNTGTCCCVTQNT